MPFHRGENSGGFEEKGRVEGKTKGARAWGLPRGLEVLALACLGLFLASGCHKREVADSKPEILAKSSEAFLPDRGGRPGYVSSKECQECHKEQYSSWHNSYHRTMTQLATPETVKADFNELHLALREETFLLSRRGAEFWVRIGEAGVAGAPGSPGEVIDLPVGLLTGSHYMQVFWMPAGAGNAQIGFPFTWLLPEGRWVPRNDTFLREPQEEAPPELWNMTCIRCHTTAGAPRPDKAAGVYRTAVAELGIACEACHGPGEAHVRKQRERKAGAVSDLTKAIDPTVVNPERLTAHRASEVCGFCHSMKWFDAHEGWEPNGFRFHPGDDLNATTPVIRAGGLDQQPWLRDVMAKHPEILGDFFWPDGMIRVSGREFNGLVESPCYQRGEMSCLSCHSMHESQPVYQLRRNREDNQGCTQCHPRYKDAPALAAHSHHPADSVGSLCYNCHMPHATYGVLRGIRSHQVSSPDVSSDLKAGRPNACSLCHLDQSLAWVDRRLGEWYQRKPGEIPAPQKDVSVVAWYALRGDAGQRALMAWHLGWAPAKETVGGTWLAAYLAQLLDDPYAAVRCVAGRSLAQVAGFSSFMYDFVMPPDRRPPMRETVWRLWEQGPQRPSESAALLLGENGRIAKELWETLLKQRDNRRVHLRE